MTIWHLFPNGSRVISASSNSGAVGVYDSREEAYRAAGEHSVVFH